MSTNWSRRLAWIGVILGVGAALFLGSIRVVNEELPWSAEMVFGEVAFTTVYLAPFALSLWAYRWPSDPARIAAWAGAALLALAGSVTAFSGVSFVLLPAAALLTSAAIVASLGGRLRDLPFVISLAGLLVLVGVASFWTLFATDDERCWQRHQFEEAGGWGAWEVVPDERAGRRIGSGTARRCTSNAIAWHESSSALGLLAVTGLVIGRARRRRP
ncbi:MAG: hypothetical protein ACH37Z_18095 [Anaerolineae bacterium]